MGYWVHSWKIKACYLSELCWDLVVRCWMGSALQLMTVLAASIWKILLVLSGVWPQEDYFDHYNKIWVHRRNKHDRTRLYSEVWLSDHCLKNWSSVQVLFCLLSTGGCCGCFEFDLCAMRMGSVGGQQKSWVLLLDQVIGKLVKWQFWWQLHVQWLFFCLVV